MATAKTKRRGGNRKGTKVAKQRKPRQTKRNRNRHHGGTRNVDSIIQEARQHNEHPLSYFVSKYLRQERDDTLLFNLVGRLAESGQIDEHTAINAVSILLISDSKFNKPIIRILLALKPIKNMQLLNQLYEDVIDNTNAHVLNVMRYAGHVPLTDRHKAQLAETLQLSGIADNTAFARIFREIVPAAKTETTNTIYSLGQREMSLPIDAVEELHSYLDADANDSYNRQMGQYIEQMDAEEAAYNEEHAGDGDFEGDANGDY